MWLRQSQELRAQSDRDVRYGGGNTCSPMLAIGVAVILVAIVIAAVSPFAGFILYWAWMLIRPQERFTGLGGEIPLERILAIGVIVSLLVHYKLLKNRKLNFKPPTTALLAFLFANYLSVPFAVWRTGALWTANDLARLIAFFLLAINLIDNERRLRVFLWTYVGCMAWTAIDSLYLYGIHPYYAQGIQRLTSGTATFGDPNATGFNLAMVIPFVFFLVQTGKTWQRLILLCCTALLAHCVILTASRAAASLLLIVFVIAALQSSRRLILIPAAILLFVITWAVLPAQYRERYTSIATFAEDPSKAGRSDVSEDESAYGRVIGFVVAWDMFVDHPLLGVGAGDFPAAFYGLNYSYKGIKGWHQPHNLPGQVLSELGLLGALTFGAFLFSIFRASSQIGSAVRRGMQESLRNARLLNRAIFSSLICLVVAGFSSHNLYRYNWYLAGALMVFAVQLSSQFEKAEATEVQELTVAAMEVV
jgi:putative inorganic carbon (HCO3(-)) transporter